MWLRHPPHRRRRPREAGGWRRGLSPSQHVSTIRLNCSDIALSEAVMIVLRAVQITGCIITSRLDHTISLCICVDGAPVRNATVAAIDTNGLTECGKEPTNFVHWNLFLRHDGTEAIRELPQIIFILREREHWGRPRERDRRPSAEGDMD